MSEGTLAEYEQLKLLAHSRFAEIEREIGNLRPFWRALKQPELMRRKERMFGPDLKRAEDARPLLEWCALAEEHRQAFRAAVAGGDYRVALFREGWVRYAEYQACLLQSEISEAGSDSSRGTQLLVPRFERKSDPECQRTCSLRVNEY